MKKGGISCAFCESCCQEAPGLILRLSLAAVLLPKGFEKVFTFGYLNAASKVTEMASEVVPIGLATVIGYFLPLAELYLGLALLLGFGKYITKVLAVLVTFMLMMFWILKSGPVYQWFFDPHTWFFIAAITLKCLPFGKLSLDALLWPDKKD